MAADGVEEHLERVAVEHILGRMDLEAEIDALILIGVEDRLPAPALLGEAFLDQAGGALRIGIEDRARRAMPVKLTCSVRPSRRETLAAFLHLRRPPNGAALPGSPLYCGGHWPSNIRS